MFNFLLVLPFLFVVYAKKNCVPLINSTVCSAFSQFYVDLNGLADTFIFLSNTTTIEEFDQRLIEYANSTNMYLYQLGCQSTNFNAQVPYARYSLTRLCAQMLQDSDSLACNTENDLVPPALCQTTCDDWVNSVTEITSNPRVCAQTTQRNNTLDYYWSQCDTWQGFNGTVNNNCISGIANEPYTCGFGSDIQQACQYCKQNSTDECCQSVQCGTHLSGGAIAGIVIGCILFTTIALLCAFCVYKKKKRNQPIKTHGFQSSSNTFHTSEDNNIEKTPQFLDTVAIPSNTVSPSFAMNHLSTTSNAVNPLVTTTDEFFVVIHPYPPQMEDELGLNIGDIVCVAVQFDDGWALGFNVTTGLKGAFPMVCISPAPKESLDRILNMDEYASFHNTSSSGKPYEDDTLLLQTTMNRIRDNVSRSISLSSYNSNNISSFNTTMINSSNNTIPKRSGSSKSYDYSDCDSPSSPTVNSPLFRSNNPLQQSNFHQQQHHPPI